MARGYHARIVIAAIWIFMGLMALLWSLASWGLHTLLTSQHAWLDDVGALLEQVPLRGVLDEWVPGWQSLVELAAEGLRWALDALGGAAPLVVWGLWGLGMLAFAAAGGVLTLIVVLLRDDRPAAAAKAES